MSEPKYIIIGWGLAGACLSWQFHIKRIPCLVYDNGQNFSSRVAAGMVNPIVFKRLTKGWKIDELMPYAATFYSEIEEKLGVELLSHRYISRVFSSVEEQNNWSALEGDSRFEAWLKPAKDLGIDTVDAPFGIGNIKSLGHLDVNAFLNYSKDYLSNHNIEFINENFEVQSLVNSNNHFIYCEGYHIADNPMFAYIPMKPAHGDILTIKAPAFNYKDILNKNMFILPLGNNLYKVGSTYNWELKDPKPSEAGKKDLIDRLTSFCHFDFEVVSHEAGIRPTVADRRPLLGTHFAKSNLHLFNGLGTKGVSIAPYYSAQLFDYLLNEGELDAEVDVKRFEKGLMRK